MAAGFGISTDAPASADPASTLWPLVGRDGELAVANASLRHGRGIVILGEAGAGKTRLAHELVGDADDVGVLWHPVVGSSGAARVPLGAWSHLLPDTWEPAGTDVATWHLLAAHLRDADGEIRLFVDDAHWLDPVSVGFLHHLVVTGQARVVVTARRDEGNDKQLVALWKEGCLTRLDLAPFGIAETEAALEAALGDPVEPHTARRLHDRSGGNVLMLRELVAAGRTDGTLRRAHGAWVQPAAGRPSPRLVDLLADRIDHLPSDERSGAELLALSEPIAENRFVQLAGSDIVDRLASRRLVHVDRAGGGRVLRSAHPLVAQVLLEHVPDLRRDAMIAALVDVFEQPGDALPATDVLRVALWRLDIGAPLTGELALHAAELALARTDFPLAERLARAAVDGGEATVGTVVLGEALVGQQRHADAEAVLAPLHHDLAGLDETLRMRYAQTRALALGTELGRVDDAVGVMRSTLATLPAGPRRRMLEARVADLLADCGHFRAAAPLAAARIRDLADDEVAALYAVVAQGVIGTLSGRCRDTLALCDEMVPVAFRHHDEVPAGVGWIAVQRMLALYVAGDLVRAEEFVTTIEAFVIDDPDTTLRALLLTFRGMMLADAGRLDEGLRYLQQAAALHELDNRRGYQSICFAITARVHAMRDELGAAERALAAARHHRWPGGQVLDFEIDAAAIWVCQRRGDRAGADALLEDAATRARREGAVTIEAYLRHEAVRAGAAPAPHVDAMRRLGPADQGGRGELWALHVTALVTGDGDGLATAAAGFADLGQHLRAAEAYAQAAVRFRAAGSRGPAARAKAQSRTERERCSGAATPALHDDDAVVGLTSRERDVVTRAAVGATNQDIASGLGISVRTVETHLQRAFDKLGVHRRSELAALFVTR